jgi:DNA-binding CsgD family transcriptional regulator
MAEYARAVLYNGVGHYEDALAAARRACDHDDLGLFGWSLTELVEAAARTGRHDLAAAAFERLRQRTSAAGTDWALGIEARSRALCADGPGAEALYREAIERLAGTRILIQLARAHLLYGEWLRREHRRLDAREQLRTAHEMLAGIGAEAFAERGRRELLATGETVGRRASRTIDALTPQEAQVARMARDGQTNPEIAAQLFISARTVEYHLRKVFTKLDIRSRKELARALPDLTSVGAASS